MRIDINKYNQDYFSILITQMHLGNLMKEKNMVVYLFRATSITQDSHLSNILSSFIATAIATIQQQYQQTGESPVDWRHERRGCRY